MKKQRQKYHRRGALLLAVILIMATAVPCYAQDTQINETDQIVLTQKEQEYVRKNPSVSIAIDTSWVPYGFSQEEESCSGIIPTMIQIVADRVGLQVEFVAKDTYADAIEACRLGETMLVSGIANDTRMSSKNEVQITDPYIQIGYSAVTKNKLSDLYVSGANYRVAICVGTYAKIAMQDEMPTYEFVEFHNNQECMDAVLHDEADIALIANYSAGYYSIWHEYRKLQIIQINDFHWGLCFGVNEDCDPQLIELLNKGIATLSENDINQAIYEGTTEAAGASERISDVFYEQPALVAAVTGALVGLAAIISVLLLSRKHKEGEFKREQEQRLKIEEALSRAEQASLSKTEFFSHMSHDMRTPMNGILGLASLSKDETDPKVLRENIAKIELSGQYLLSIINDTLDFQRIESGKIVLEPEIVNCREVVQSVIDMVRPAIAEKHIDFQVVSKTAVLDCAVRMDQVRIKQIFINLISNAIKFTPEGGRISVEFDCLGQEKGMLHECFTIRDTGVGMSEDFVKNKIFQPFSQERNALSGQYAGSGLGLSIVKKLVDLMGGTIEVESTPGAGTAFVICMEIEKVDPAAAVQADIHREERQKTAITKLKGCRILLTEDHPLNAEIATKLLEKAGCSVTWAKDGQECVTCIAQSEEHTYDLILMDVRMPVMDGLSAARAIRQMKRPDAQALPIIAMTANAYTDDVANCLAAGMNAHISKPIQPAVMYQTISDVMYRLEE